MGGRHAHRHPSGSGPRGVLVAVALLLAGVAAAMVLLWPDAPVRTLPEPAGEQLSGTVTALDASGCAEQPASGGTRQPCGSVEVLLDDVGGGSRVSTAVPAGPGAPVLAVGDAVVVLSTPANPPELRYQIVDHQRGLQLWVLVAAVALAVLAFGRWRGLSALLGLGVTFAVVMLFMIPAVLSGRPPLAVAVVGSAAIALTVLYLTHGISRTTTVAVTATLASLTLTGLLALVSVEAMHLTGMADDTSSTLGQLYGVNMEGLLLAGILIGSLGVLDDVTVTQAATVEELAVANPGYTARQLFGAANRVGRAHVASVINTIVLAYAGAALPLLVLVTALSDPAGQVLSDQLIATEIVRSATGTLGLVAAVPLASALAAWWGARPHSR